MKTLRALTLLGLIWLVLDPSPALGYVVYTLIGLQVIGWVWPWIARAQLDWQRQAPLALAPDEIGEVAIVITYRGRLPLPYLVVSEDIPPTLSSTARKRWVISPKPGQSHALRYQIQGRQRGLYWLGPMHLAIGSVLDINESRIAGQRHTPLTILPVVVPLPLLNLPTGLPMAQERRRISLFDDPAQQAGTRLYRPGDPPRRIDWKTSARQSALHVRELTPVIARETTIALAFSEREYRGRFARDDRERAVIAAASLATALIHRRQPVGLRSNGIDPLTGTVMDSLPPAADSAHLREILLRLGRLETISEGSLVADLLHSDLNMVWGGTLVVITSALDEHWIAGLKAIGQRGIHTAIALVDPGPTDLAQARRYRIAAYQINRHGAIVPA